MKTSSIRLLSMSILICFFVLIDPSQSLSSNSKATIIVVYESALAPLGRLQTELMEGQSNASAYIDGIKTANIPLNETTHFTVDINANEFQLKEDRWLLGVQDVGAAVSLKGQLDDGFALIRCTPGWSTYTCEVE